MLRKEDVQRKWYLVDAKGMVLGRLATRIARILMGKHKPIYTPHVDCGDGVILVNVDKVRLSGKKIKQKTYTHYTGYPSGLRTRTVEEVLQGKPTQVMQLAVKRMLPKNKLGSRMIKRLKLYSGEGHRDDSLKPERLSV